MTFPHPIVESSSPRPSLDALNPKDTLIKERSAASWAFSRLFDPLFHHFSSEKLRRIVSEIHRNGVRFRRASFSQRIPKRSKGFEGFSLVELLAVLALGGILLGISFTSLRGHMGTVRLSTAGTHCATLFESARETAMLRNSPVAVAIFPATIQAPTALTALEYQPSSQTWLRISEWKKLPTGIVFDPTVRTEVNGAIGVNSPVVTPTLLPIEYAGSTYSSGGTDGYAYLVFLPSGALLQSHPRPGLLRLVEGIRENQTIRHTGPLENYIDLIINPWTGRLKIVRP